MPKIVAIYGSPRRKGNTATLLNKAVQGARESGADVQEFVLRDLKISPCLEIYGCQKTGRCIIKDDFHQVADAIMEANGLMLASPIFFYSVSAHTKILIDRFQSLWVRKYWLEKRTSKPAAPARHGLYISVGATKGQKLFSGSLLTIKYFFDVIDMSLWKSLLYRSLDFEGDVLKHPAYLEETYQAGKAFAELLTDASQRSAS
jgi:multimeric flavodoxin WrbA